MSETNGWQPIETAPKDGSYFVIARAGDPDFFEVGKWRPMVWTNYVPAGEGLFRQEETLISEFGGGFNNFHRATHWMPLPLPPEPTP